MSAEAEVLAGGPVVLLVVALLEDVPHRVLLIGVVHHAHLVELHLSEERFPLALLPGVLGFRLAGHLLVQDQLGVVEADADGDLVAGDGADVLLVGADAGDLLVEVVGLDGEDLLDDLGKKGSTACSWALQMALIWCSGSMGWSAVSSLILSGKRRMNCGLGLALAQSRYSRILAWIWPSDISNDSNYIIISPASSRFQGQATREGKGSA